MNFYDFEAQLNTGEIIQMQDYTGKKVLIVNTASKCGYTPQYSGLQKLYEDNKGQLVVLAFPCNQFGAQEPAANSKIKEFCELNFNIKFPIFNKVEVNGENTHPLFKYLKKSLPGLLGTEKIKWNFTKFLIDEHGKPEKRFSPQDTPEKIQNFLSLKEV